MISVRFQGKPFNITVIQDYSPASNAEVAEVERILSLCLFNFYAEYIMRNAGWMKHKLESRLPGEISITSDTQMTTPLWQKVKKN